MSARKKKRTKKSARNRIFIAILLILFSVGLVFAIRAMSRSYLYHTYPVGHRDLVLEAAERYKIPPETVFAVIKAESNFREDAVSPVGAVGLMQILPTTAEWIAGRRGETFDPGTLSDPVINLDYGCYYLSYLYDRFGEWDAAHAAYNAGPATVDRWMKDPAVRKDGSFVSIPYEETDRYLKRIREYKIRYSELYATKGWNENG